MISALAWVRKGVAAEKPTTYEMTEEEYSNLQAVASEEIADAKKELKKKSKLDAEILNDPALKDFNLESYDSEPSDTEDPEGTNINVFSNIKGLSYYQDAQEDPYITLKDADDSDEDEEMRIFGSDNILLVAKTEDDISNLEVCVFEGEGDNLFVHHDFMLPAFPLTVEWLDFRVGRKAGQEGGGNYVAVGTFEPRIEIWDLDTVDSTYPDLVLGSTDKKMLRKRKGKPHPEFHTDAIMGLSWNKNVRNLLASSSADTTVKLWDLNSGKCVQSYEHHKDKVQAVQWHPTEASVMLTGGYDRQVAAFDSRAPAAISWWSVDADVESIMWDVHSPSHFFVATEAGSVRYFDIRNVKGGKGAAPIYTLVAHDEAVSAMDQHPTVPGLLVTGSADETVKVWDVRENRPTMVISRNLDVGNVFAASFCPDETMLMAVAGSKGETRIWDISTNAAVRSIFGDASIRTLPVVEKPLVSIVDEADGDEDDTREAIIAEMHGDVMEPVEAVSEDDEDDDDEDDEEAEDDSDASMESDSDN
ncbi:WD40-repeat-containing domain protein [Kickxella alabastrina]|uniref:WD40-repeat-containing domain protein n=1 Tax=Kickxella alabastrina TaxID=61397 RepID=UPI0022211FCC|nr:WD40-repeat-containing domain protein [Kickxella alabastrina]KAI7824490.1 WD40-repeat-containing domain protein [Kickxella alabastrina]